MGRPHASETQAQADRVGKSTGHLGPTPLPPAPAPRTEHFDTASGDGDPGESPFVQNGVRGGDMRMGGKLGEGGLDWGRCLCTYVDSPPPLYSPEMGSPW